MYSESNKIVKLKDLKFTQNSYAITYKAAPQFIDYFYHNLKTS